MTLLLDGRNRDRAASAPTEWPPEVDFIMSALDVGGYQGSDRRKPVRHTYRVPAALKLFSDEMHAPPRILYTRDVNERGLGFITRHRLPLGHGGVLRLKGPNGQDLRIECTLLRCRETVQGWSEGSMYFNREQWMFALDALKKQ